MWLTNWICRKLITINGQVGAGTDYQVLLKVGESSGAVSYDFHVEGNSILFPSDTDISGDIRFTTDDGETLLPFWVEKVTGAYPNRLAYIWVKISSSLESNANIYCYYQNSGASNVSSGVNTFILFNDGSSITGMTEVGSGITWSATSGKVKAQATGDWKSESLFFDTTTGLNSYRIIATTSLGGDVGGNPPHEMGFRFYTSQGGSTGLAKNTLTGYHTGTWDIVGDTGTDTSAPETILPNIDYKLTFIKDDDDWNLLVNDISKITRNESGFNAQYVGLWANIRFNNYTVYFDNIYVTKYNTIEPNFNTAGNEQANIVETFNTDIRFVKTILNNFNTDFRMTTSIKKLINSFLAFVKGFKINSDLRFLKRTANKINTDLRFKYADETIDLIDREDFVIKVDSISLTDVILSSINIIHGVDQDSTASFQLARKHDNINYTLSGVYSRIDNQNDVAITLKGVTVFTGKITNLNCDSENEIVTVSCTGSEWSKNLNTVNLPLTTLNTQISPYDVLVDNIQIDNPVLDTRCVIISEDGQYWNGTEWKLQKESAQIFADSATTLVYIASQSANTIFTDGNPSVENYDDNPLHYSGIKVDLGEQESESVELRSLNYANVDDLEEGTFKFIPNYTYFWTVHVNLYNIWAGGTSKVFYNKYIGTSLAPLSSDLYEIVGAFYGKQKIRDNYITKLGFYYVGIAPFKSVSCKNGKYIPAYYWSDEIGGLYARINKSYDYIQYAKDVAAAEYELLKNANGKIFGETGGQYTSASVDLTLDGFLYYKLALLTKINLVNTTTTNIYKNNNGFPLRIKLINIDSGAMKVSVNVDNLTIPEDAADYPVEPEEIPQTSTLIKFKFDLPTESDVE